MTDSTTVPPGRVALTAGIGPFGPFRLPLSREDRAKVERALIDVENQIIAVHAALSSAADEPIEDKVTEVQLRSYERVAMSLRSLLQTDEERNRHRDAMRLQWLGLVSSVASTLAAIAAAVAAWFASR